MLFGIFDPLFGIRDEKFGEAVSVAVREEGAFGVGLEDRYRGCFGGAHELGEFGDWCIEDGFVERGNWGVVNLGEGCDRFLSLGLLKLAGGRMLASLIGLIVG